MRLVTATFLLTAMIGLAQENPIAKAMEARWSTAKRNLIEAAKAMPEADYGFQLTSAQRSYGDWVTHTAGLFENSCTAMTGGGAPAMDHSKHGSVSKDAAVSMLESAAKTCDVAFAALTDAKLSTPVGPKSTMPVQPALGLLVNAASHYGNMVGYLRSKGIVPPSTARAAAAAKP
jgi:uncharacterized damage-inducible protein DinB